MPGDHGPNVLFLLSDEHSFRFLGHRSAAQGGEPVLTPALDRLAANGTEFSDAYCQMPLCTPSRLCLLTGLDVRKCGAWSNRAVLRPGLATIPETLAAAGYETALVGKMHLGGNRQFVGFQHRPYGDLTGFCGHQWEPLDDEERHSMRSRTRDAGVTEVPESLIQDEVVAQETIAFLREQRHRDPDRPWFVCASFSRPHFPLTAPRRWFERYWPDGVTRPSIDAGGDAYDHPMSVGMRRGFKAEEVDDEEMMKARAGYFACVSYLDEVIGDLLVRLESDGLLQNTMIIYTTDHGEMAGEHGVWWKNGWYEGCTRVPLIASLPEQRYGGLSANTVRTPVGLTDLFPTICGLCDVVAPPGLDGRNLAHAVMEGTEPDDQPVCCDALTPRWGKGTEFRSIRWRQFKFVRFRDAPSLMFDLDADPGEQHNLLADDLSAQAAAARDMLVDVADRSMDFDDAERERTERDGDLADRFKQHVPGSTGNLYLMPSGKLVNADDELYHPTVIAETPEEAFSDWPGRM